MKYLIAILSLPESLLKNLNCVVASIGLATIFFCIKVILKITPFKRLNSLNLGIELFL